MVAYQRTVTARRVAAAGLQVNYNCRIKPGGKPEASSAYPGRCCLASAAVAFTRGAGVKFVSDHDTAEEYPLTPRLPP